MLLNPYALATGGGGGGGTPRNVLPGVSPDATPVRSPALIGYREAWLAPRAISWDPAFAASPLQIINGGKDLFLPTGNTLISKTGRTTQGLSSGKWYWEILVVDIINGAGTTTGVGVVGASHPSTTANIATDSATNNFGWWCSGDAFQNGAFIGTIDAFADGNVLMLALDASNGKVWTGVNGVWFNSGNPAAGTNFVVTMSTIETFYPAACPFASIAETVQYRLQSTPSYSVPSGFTNYVFA